MVDNLNLFKKINDPLVEILVNLQNTIRNLMTYLNILVQSKNTIKDSYSSFFNIPFENMNYIFTKIFNEINYFSFIIDKLQKACKDKIFYENLALDEKNPTNSSDQYQYTFKIKVSLTLKNQNNEFLSTFPILTSSLNSFFSILFQIAQVFYFISH